MIIFYLRFRFLCNHFIVNRKSSTSSYRGKSLYVIKLILLYLNCWFSILPNRRDFNWNTHSQAIIHARHHIDVFYFNSKIIWWVFISIFICFPALTSRFPFAINSFNLSLSMSLQWLLWTHFGSFIRSKILRLLPWQSGAKSGRNGKRQLIVDVQRC